MGEADLDIVATLPEYQGRGAAGELIRWGINKADEAGLEVYLEASPPAVPVYEHYGFTTVDTFTPSDFNYTESFMVRRPRKAEQT